MTEKQKVQWIKDAFYETRSVNWAASFEEEVIDLPEPITFFEKYISEYIYEEMSAKTNLYATQQQFSRFSATNIAEIKKFVGIHILMGNLNLPRIKMYWDSSIGISIIKENMTLKRFSKLRQSIHLVDITAREVGNTDRLWKVRSIYNSIRSRCLELPLETDLCIDEQMVPFKGQINIKQYIKNKPKKWGIKLFVLAGQSGQIYDFIIYQGSTTEIEPELTALGSSAAVIMHLCQRIVSKNHRLYFDNYFSSYQLFQYLAMKSIFAVGTVRLNRFCNPPLPTDSVMKREGRGSAKTVVSKDGIIITKWFDNKAVLVASNFIGQGTSDTCRRWDKAEKRYIEVSRPECIKLYNDNMGGVDKADFLLSLYRSHIRSRKWTLRMISHAFDMALLNAWLEYRRKADSLGIAKKNVLDLLGFRQHVAEKLILYKAPPKRGRPSSSSVSDAQLSVQNCEKKPATESRYDGYGHFPEYDEKKEAGRCKLEGCRKKVHTFCMKCKVHLCLVKGRNCFFNFHSK